MFVFKLPVALVMITLHTLRYRKFPDGAFLWGTCCFLMFIDKPFPWNPTAPFLVNIGWLYFIPLLLSGYAAFALWVLIGLHLTLLHYLVTCVHPPGLPWLLTWWKSELNEGNQVVNA